MSVTDCTVGGVTVNDAVLFTDPSVAVIVAFTVDATAVVVTVNVAVECPDRTVTDAGAVTPLNVLLLERETDVFDVALALSVTVPVTVAVAP